MTAAETKIQVADLCLKHQVQRLQMFGSAARGEAGQGSDIDFIVQFKEMIPAEYARHFFGLIHDLEDRLQSPIDLLTWESVRRPVLRQSIEQDAVLLYEA